MKKVSYLLDDEDFMKIEELCNGLELAISKIIQSTCFNRPEKWRHPAIEGFERMLSQELESDRGQPDEI